MFTIIIILIVVLIITAIFINAFQQHRAKVDAERRAEVAKQRAIVDETENVIMACNTIPISQRLMQILHRRVLNALKIMNEMGSAAPDIKQRISDAETRTANLDASDTAQLSEFTLPDNDKLIIQYIQAVKKLRILLRSEHGKGKTDTKTYIEEEKYLERLQLKVNVETLVKRGNAALQANMLGSARQYFEKAVVALENQTQPDDYVKTRILTVKQSLADIQNNLKNVNAQDRAKKKADERNELDELFAPKKKW
ncbi:hypothetical protein CA267_018375 [Alteromonas pelagimontana]|uniref:DNA repair protein n=1 Tax=Alteromonas pelagimontana TaxID=1858656 RepID=A0A6M4MHJ6_9ALTE|nr:hypothetical protein [Alteromonas pelagimontana]QJR82579.1 hypothetical protein CA267_018375 [Alteromonas pelagimontana]